MSTHVAEQSKVWDLPRSPLHTRHLESSSQRSWSSQSLKAIFCSLLQHPHGCSGCSGLEPESMPFTLSYSSAKVDRHQVPVLVHHDVLVVHVGQAEPVLDVVQQVVVVPEGAGRLAVLVQGLTLDQFHRDDDV